MGDIVIGEAPEIARNNVISLRGLVPTNTSMDDDIEWFEIIVENEIEGCVWLRTKQTFHLTSLYQEMYFEFESDLALFIMRAELRKQRHSDG